MGLLISAKEISEGIYGFPPISINTQNILRSKKKIQYTKIGRNVYYKQEWIEAYINSNIRSAKNNTLGDAHEK